MLSCTSHISTESPTTSPSPFPASSPCDLLSSTNDFCPFHPHPLSCGLRIGECSGSVGRQLCLSPSAANLTAQHLHSVLGLGGEVTPSPQHSASSSSKGSWPSASIIPVLSSVQPCGQHWWDPAQMWPWAPIANHKAAPGQEK